MADQYRRFDLVLAPFIHPFDTGHNVDSAQSFNTTPTPIRFQKGTGGGQRPGEPNWPVHHLFYPAIVLESAPVDARTPPARWPPPRDSIWDQYGTECFPFWIQPPPPGPEPLQDIRVVVQLLAMPFRLLSPLSRLMPWIAIDRVNPVRSIDYYRVLMVLLLRKIEGKGKENSNEEEEQGTGRMEMKVGIETVNQCRKELEAYTTLPQLRGSYVQAKAWYTACVLAMKGTIVFELESGCGVPDAIYRRGQCIRSGDTLLVKGKLGKPVWIRVHRSIVGTRTTSSGGRISLEPGVRGFHLDNLWNNTPTSDVDGEGAVNHYPWQDIIYRHLSPSLFLYDIPGRAFDQHAIRHVRKDNSIVYRELNHAMTEITARKRRSSPARNVDLRGLG